MRFDIFKRLGHHNSLPGSPTTEYPAWNVYTQTHEGSRNSGSDHSRTQASGESTRRRRLQKRASGSQKSQSQNRRASRDTGYATATPDAMESFEILPSPDSEVGVYHNNLAASSTTSSEGRLYYKEFSADDLTEDSHGLTRSYPKPIDTFPPPMSSRGQSPEHQPTHIPVDEEGYSRRTSALDYSPAESPVLPSLFEGYPSGLPTSDSSSFNYDRPDPTLQDVPRSTPTYHDPEIGVSPSVPVHHSHTEERPPRRHSHHSRPHHHHKRSRHRNSHDQERKKPSTYYIVPGGMRVIFRDREGNEITRVGNWSETRQKHISPIIVQDENGNVLYRSDSGSESSGSPPPPPLRTPRTTPGAEWQDRDCPNCTRQRSSTSWQTSSRSYISYPRDERPNIVLIDGDGRQIPL